jgi:hypothetical protein
MTGTQFFNNAQDIEQWLKNKGITDYVIHPNLTVDVNEAVFLMPSNLKFFPVQFGKIKGDFNCTSNNLTSLLGAPYEVDGKFSCEDNQLQSLKYGPKKINGSYICANNQLTSLDYLAQGIHDSINFSHNQITSLKGLHLNLSFALLVVGNPLEKMTYQDIEHIDAHCFYADFEQIRGTVFPSNIMASLKLDVELNIINFKEVKDYLKIEHEKNMFEKSIPLESTVKIRKKL